MRYRNLAIALGLLLAAGSPLQGQNLGAILGPRADDEITRVGTRGANFLQIGVGARAMALGGAGASLEGGLSSLYWNTAGLADVPGAALGVSSADLFGDSGLRHTFAGLALPLGEGAVGASVSYFTSGEIERTTEAYPDGNDPSAGAVVEWRGTALGVHYARRVTDRLAVGVAGKLVEEGLDLATARYLAFDIGTIFDVGIYGLTVAASITNVGTEGRFEGGLVSSYIPDQREVFDAAGDRTVRHDTHKMPLPTALHFSIRSSLFGPPSAVVRPDGRHRLDVFAEVMDGVDTGVQPSMGVEYGFRGIFFLRGGKRFFNESQAPWEFSDGLSGGLGVRLPFLRRTVAVDYAYVSMGDLDRTQLFTVEFGF